MELWIDKRKKTYLVTYTKSDTNNCAYLFIEPKTPMKRVEGSRLILDETSIPSIVILRTKNPIEMNLPQILKNSSATYQFSLYDNEQREGEPLRIENIYIGLEKTMQCEWREGKNGFGKMVISCNFFISSELFWLSFFNINISMRFFFPKMQLDENRYETFCWMKDETYEKVRLVLDEKISDCFSIQK